MKRVSDTMKFDMSKFDFGSALCDYNDKDKFTNKYYQIRLIKISLQRISTTFLLNQTTQSLAETVIGRE